MEVANNQQAQRLPFLATPNEHIVIYDNHPSTSPGKREKSPGRGKLELGPEVKSLHRLSTDFRIPPSRSSDHEYQPTGGAHHGT